MTTAAATRENATITTSTAGVPVLEFSDPDPTRQATRIAVIPHAHRWVLP